jgi:hypothetical protein
MGPLIEVGRVDNEAIGQSQSVTGRAHDTIANKFCERPSKVEFWIATNLPPDRAGGGFLADFSNRLFDGSL